MKTEIERKFLVSGDGWRALVAASVEIVDGLIFEDSGSKLRVRREPGRALLTFKGEKDGPARREFEYEIPLDEADRLLGDHCQGRLVRKVRHLAPFGGLWWEIDVYLGEFEGLILAEVELERPDQPIARPPWIGEEVTGRPEYRKVNLRRGSRPWLLVDQPA